MSDPVVLTVKCSNIRVKGLNWVRSVWLWESAELPVWKGFAALAPLCCRNTIFPSAKAFASFAFQWNQQIGPSLWSKPFYCNQQKSLPVSCHHLIKFHKLSVSGSLKGMLLPQFPKITWTGLRVLCAKIQLKSVRIVSITTPLLKTIRSLSAAKGLAAGL